MSEQIEWAVVFPAFRIGFDVAQGELPSREEAEAWCAALQVTENRQAKEALYRSDAIVQPRRYEVRWRRVDAWHLGSPRSEDEGGEGG